MPRNNKLDSDKMPYTPVLEEEWCDVGVKWREGPRHLTHRGPAHIH